MGDIMVLVILVLLASSAGGWVALRGAQAGGAPDFWRGFGAYAIFTGFLGALGIGHRVPVGYVKTGAPMAIGVLLGFVVVTLFLASNW